MKSKNQKISYKFSPIPDKLFDLLSPSQTYILWFLLRKGIANGPRPISFSEMADGCRTCEKTAKRNIIYLESLRVIEILRSQSSRHLYSLRRESDWTISTSMSNTVVVKRANALTNLKTKSLLDLLCEYRDAICALNKEQSLLTVNVAVKARDAIATRLKRARRSFDVVSRNILKSSRTIFDVKQAIENDQINSIESVDYVINRIKSHYSEKKEFV